MKIYSSFAELNGKLLQHGDRVIFECEGFRIEYVVDWCRLFEINNNRKIENEIFKRLSQTRLLPLGLDPFEFCKQHYTKLYPDWKSFRNIRPNFWPPYWDEDYKSITKVVLELFRLIEEPERLKETSEILFID